MVVVFILMAIGWVNGGVKKRKVGKSEVGKILLVFLSDFRTF
jgi:hypothetical protein